MILLWFLGHFFAPLNLQWRLFIFFPFFSIFGVGGARHERRDFGGLVSRRRRTDVETSVTHVETSGDSRRGVGGLSLDID